MNKEKSLCLQIDFEGAPGGLIPVIAQHFQSWQVLLLAFTDARAFNLTRQEGLAWFFSRSRQELWKKGATSGDLLAVRDIRVNCEQNSLLYLVETLGQGACHARDADRQNYFSCFYRCLDKSGELRYVDQKNTPIN